MEGGHNGRLNWNKHLIPASLHPPDSPLAPKIVIHTNTQTRVTPSPPHIIPSLMGAELGDQQNGCETIGSYGPSQKCPVCLTDLCQTGPDLQHPGECTQWGQGCYTHMQARREGEATGTGGQRVSGTTCPNVAFPQKWNIIAKVYI